MERAASLGQTADHTATTREGAGGNTTSRWSWPDSSASRRAGRSRSVLAMAADLLAQLLEDARRQVGHLGRLDAAGPGRADAELGRDPPWPARQHDHTV